MHAAQPFSLASRQRGVALITVLLVFAIVAVIAAEMLRRSQLNLRSVSNLIDSRQTYYYAMGGEALARQVLALDVRNQKVDKDSLDEDWAKVGELPPFEIDNGAIKVEIHDLQGRFNLNSVVDKQGLPAAGDALFRLQQLFAAIGVDARYAGLWRDWVDCDQTGLGNCAEDAAYPDYKTAGAPEAEISALRLLRDMKPEDYDKIAPHVATLPPSTSININTADSTVLRALGPIIGGQASQIRSRQQRGGYADLAELQSLLPDPDIAGLDVKSSYFEVITTVKYLDRVQRLRSVLHRDHTSKTITVLSRSHLPFYDSASDPDNSENSQP